MAHEIRAFLKESTETLVKEVGVEAACAAAGKSKATIGRYYSRHDEHADRFMPVDTVALLEREAGRPLVTASLAELAGVPLSPPSDAEEAMGRRFAALMATTGVADLAPARARALLEEANALDEALSDLRRHLADAAR